MNQLNIFLIGLMIILAIYAYQDGEIEIAKISTQVQTCDKDKS